MFDDVDWVIATACLSSQTTTSCCCKLQHTTHTHEELHQKYKKQTYQQLSCHQEQPQCFDAADWVTMTIYDNQLQHSTTETLTHHSISNTFKVHLP